MADSLEAMALLLLVVDSGSFSAAAKKQRVPLATVSRKVIALERRVGAQLLVRGQRRVTLSDAGRAYVDGIRPLLEQLKIIEQAAAGETLEPQGELSLTAPALFGRRHVSPLFAQFLAAHTAIRGRLLLTDRHVNLREEGVDVAVRMGELHDASLIAVNVGSVQRVVCATPAYLQKRGRPRRPEELDAHDAILFEGPSSASRWDFERGKKTVLVRPNYRLVVNDTEAAVEGALANFGFARVFSYQVDELLRAGALVAVLKEFAPRPTPVRVVYTDRQPLPRKVRLFVDFARTALRERLSRAAVIP